MYFTCAQRPSISITPEFPFCLECILVAFALTFGFAFTLHYENLSRSGLHNALIYLYELVDLLSTSMQQKKHTFLWTYMSVHPVSPGICYSLRSVLQSEHRESIPHVTGWTNMKPSVPQAPRYVEPRFWHWLRLKEILNGTGIWWTWHR